MNRKPEFSCWGCEGYFNRYAYRTFRIHHLVEMFQNGKNVLVHPSKWEDPYDNWVVHLAEQLGVHISSCRSVFGQCWSLTNDEEIHWKLYAPQMDGVLVRSTTDALAHTLRVIDDAFVSIGKVQYWSRQQFSDLFAAHANAEATGEMQSVGSFFCYPKALQTVMKRPSQLCDDHLLKRQEFAFEAEIRLLCSPDCTPTRWDLFTYPVDPTALINEIVFDPRMNHNLAKIYERYFRECGFVGQIRQSRLYEIALPSQPNVSRSIAAMKVPSRIPASAWVVRPQANPKDLSKFEVLTTVAMPTLGNVEILRNACGGIEISWNNRTTGIGLGSSLQEWRRLSRSDMKKHYQNDLRLSDSQLDELFAMASSERVGHHMKDDPFAWFVSE